MFKVLNNLKTQNYGETISNTINHSNAMLWLS